MSNTLEIDRFIKRKEIAKILSLSDSTVKNMIEENKLIKPISIDGFTEKLFSLDELKKWMEQQKEKRNQNK